MTKEIKRLPHLACDVDYDKLKISAENPMMGMPKIDGVRGMHLIGSMTGRSLKSHGNKHVTEKYSNPYYTGFDGEFTFGDIRGESLCRDTTGAMSRISGEPNVVWNVFDYLIAGMENLPYIERYNKLVQYVTYMGAKLDSVHVVPFVWLRSIEEVEAYYQTCLDDGYEGIIIRDPQGLHKSGRATTKVGAYLRMKPQSDKEAKVVRLVEAMENLNEAKINELGRTERSSHKENKAGKGMVGMLVCIDCTSGMEIDVGAGKMTHEERTHFWNNPDEIVGHYIKFRSMDVGVKDKPRFARYICKRSVEDMSS